MNVLVVLGEGGHTTEILKLVDLLGPIYHYSYLIPIHDHTSKGKIKMVGPVYRANLPRGKRSNLLTTLKDCFMCSVQQFRILLRAQPAAILSAGAGIAVPISIFGRLLGAKIIYVETACRVRMLSVTGRILYCIAHLFFVQWESLVAQYPKAIYAGRLL